MAFNATTYLLGVWCGHVKTMQEDRIAKLIVDWIPWG